MKNNKNSNEPYNSLNKNQSKSLLITNNDLPVHSLYQILSKNPKLVNIIDNNGETLLSYSIKNKKEDICQLILSSKILDLSYQDKMGNSYCCTSYSNKTKFIIQSEILVDCVENNKFSKKKTLKINNLNKFYLRKEFTLNKTITTLSPQPEDDNDFINPLPDIVTIKYKKH